MATPAPAPRGGTMPHAPHLLGSRILVVDDVPADARLVESILLATGYTRVTTITDPLAAAALDREHRFDLVILDLMMPGRNGYEVMAELGAAEGKSPPPVLVMTADPDELQRALLAGARDFVAKPIRAIELRARVRNLLDMHFALTALKRRGSELEEELGASTASLVVAERRFRALVEQSVAGIYMVENGLWTYVNPRMCQILGHAAGEVVGRPTIDFVAEADHTALQAHRQLVFSGVKSSLSATFRMRRGDGEMVHVRVEAKYISTGGHQTFLGVAQDVTEQLRSQELLLEAQQQRELAVGQLESANRRLQVLSDRVLAVQEEERRYISSELHDDVGQSLLALQLGMHRLGEIPALDSARLLEECAGIVSGVQEKLRQLSVRLHPPQLAQLGLQEAVGALVSRQRATTGLDIRCRCEGPEPGILTPELETAAYRICQEALSNATRHSGAQRVEVRTKLEADRFCLSVSDDGSGFDASARGEAASEAGHMGLTSMEERARLAGGSLELVTAPGAGTVVIAIFPRPDAQRAAAVAPSP